MHRFCVILFVLLVPTVGLSQRPNRARSLELFEKRIRPALIEHCYECHAMDSDDLGGNLLLDSRQGVRVGGDSGPSVVPGNPNDSLLVRAIEYRDLEMPPNEKLPDDLIADFRRWVALGAADPRSAAKSVVPDDDKSTETKSLWSLQRLNVTDPPLVQDESWPQQDFDRFVLAELESNGLAPNSKADPATLLRRVYFDLIGLPPSPQQVDEFLADPSQTHFATIVDRLLGSPEFGERWGRHWLDVARYGESAGSSRDVLNIYAWRYRDFVFDALNQDMPFDQFVRWQIAGDLLPAETVEQKKRQTVATGLLAIGSKSLNGGNLTYDMIDDQIDVVSKSVLGLTVACARCHDHKFDPIPTTDYYALAGIFLSTDTRYGGGTKRPTSPKDRAQQYLPLSGDLDPKVVERQAKALAKVAPLEKQIASSRKRVKTLQAAVPKEFRDGKEPADTDEPDPKTAASIRQLHSALRILKERESALAEAKAEVGDEPEYAVGVRDAGKITDAKVLIRGEKNQTGDIAPRGFLSVLGDRCETSSIDGSESGRRELADWLVHPDHPLTPRVAVNRVWQHLMGSGIVETVDNFGASGTLPSHPRMLDYLADRFMHAHDWSTKGLVRELVLSQTYQLSSELNEDAFAADPDNRLRWRMPRRRLEAEPLRDAILQVSGLLDRSPLQGSLVMQIGEGEVGRNLDIAVLEEPFDHRSVYLPIIRGIMPESLKLFDFPEPSNVQGQRDSNTTPTQSLFLMNSPFAIRAARAMAEQLLTSPVLRDDEQRIREARVRCFGAPARDAHVDRDLQFVHQMSASLSKDDEAKQIAWTAYCQSLLASAKFRFID